MNTTRTYTADEDRAMQRLEQEDIVHFNTIKSVPELNTFRGLEKRGLCRFARLPKNVCGYTMMESFLKVVR